MGWHTETITAEGYEFKVAVKNYYGYDYVYDGEKINFTKDGEIVAIGSFYDMQYYDQYAKLYEKNYDAQKVDGLTPNCTMYDTNHKSTEIKSAAIYKLNSDVFLLVTSKYTGDVRELTQLLEITVE
jgi:hypothetical protein